MRVLLVGAGHAHLHVVDQTPRLRRAGIDVRLVAPARFLYSGSASASATGSLPRDAGLIDVAAFAARRGASHVDGLLDAVDLERRRATTVAGTSTPYDLISFNVGSVAASDGLHVAPDVPMIKPLERLIQLSTALERSADLDRISIVGAGATGLELAGNLAARCGGRGRITVFEQASRPGHELPPSARRRVVRRLTERGVRFRVDTEVTRVAADHLVVADRRHDHDLAVVATGLVAPPLVTALGLGDARGIPVRGTLQHVDRDEVYAVGDCARFTPRELPKLGVHAVRAAAVLVDGLLARREGRPPPRYEPQEHALQILDLGGGTGLAWRDRLWFEGRAARRLKLAIDRRWLARYR